MKNPNQSTFSDAPLYFKNKVLQYFWSKVISQKTKESILKAMNLSNESDLGTRGFSSTYSQIHKSHKDAFISIVVLEIQKFFLTKNKLRSYPELDYANWWHDEEWCFRNQDTGIEDLEESEMLASRPWSKIPDTPKLFIRHTIRKNMNFLDDRYEAQENAKK